MNKLRGSVIAKLVAWVLCITSLMGTIIFGILTLVGIDKNFFNKSRNEALQELYEIANAEYSITAFRNIDNSNYAEALADNCFKFGIVQADSLKDIDFHDERSYIQTNMTAEELKAVDPEKLFLYQIVKKGDYSLGSVSRGYYGDYDEISKLDEISSYLRDEYGTEQSYLYADRICYDVAKGIIYYRADGNYYPVQNVSLQYNGGEEPILYNYSYDFGKKGYKLNYYRPIDNITEDLIAEESEANIGEVEIIEDTEVPEQTEIMELAEQTEALEETTQEQNLPAASVNEDLSKDDSMGKADYKSDEIDAILKGSGTGSIVNLAELTNTTFNYNNWGMLVLDNIRYIRGDELMPIDSTNFSEGYFINEPGYYLNENFTLVVETTVDSKNYWVVSLIPESVPAELTDSKYCQYSRLADMYYGIGLNIVQGFGISVVVAVISLVFLACAAGHRKNKQEITLTFVDRIPVDLLGFAVFVIEYILLVVCVYTLQEMSGRSWNSTVVAYLGILGAAALMITVIGVWSLLSLCVRVKSGKWWRNSICYRIYSRIYSAVRHILVTIFRNLNLLWKLILLIGVVSFAEFCVIVGFDRGSIVLFWLLEKLVVCVLVLLLAVQMYELQKASRHMAEGELSYKINTEKMFWECKKHGDNLNKIGEGMSKAVDERMKSERFRTELITNVSHDIKTPLTSIINYVDLLEKEELNNEKASEYLEVLDRQSSKLKKLIEDLMEASKAASGSLPVSRERIDAGVFITQTVGEFEERLSLAGMELIISKPDEQAYIMTDGRHLWRIFDNLMSNVCKYAHPNSRVYVTLEVSDKQVSITFRNMSKYPLNISGEELMERFVRGDKSRNTEGHGLGLSIAQSLMKMIDGEMQIVVDGDLFKVILTFERYL